MHILEDVYLSKMIFSINCVKQITNTLGNSTFWSGIQKKKYFRGKKWKNLGEEVLSSKNNGTFNILYHFA